MNDLPSEASLILPPPLSSRELLLRHILVRILALAAVMLLAQA